MPEDHSELVPLLPIPNRTVKRLSADDSADTRVKVGHSQAIKVKKPGQQTGLFLLILLELSWLREVWFFVNSQQTVDLIFGYCFLCIYVHIYYWKFDVYPP